MYYSSFGGTPTRVVAGFWAYWASFPGADAMIAKIDMGPCEARLIMQSSGEPYIKGDGTPTMGSVVYGSNLVAGVWYWIELMADKTVNPWIFRARIHNATIETSGAATASNCGSDFVLLGNNNSATHATRYSLLKYGTSSTDDDWVTPSHILNGSFETDLSYWSNYATASSARSNTQAKEGSWSCRVTTAAADDGITYPKVEGLSISTTYYLSAWVYTDSTEQIAVGWNEFTSADGYLTTVQTQPVITGGVWTKITCSAATQATGTKIQPFVSVRNTAVNFYVDSVWLATTPQPAEVDSTYKLRTISSGARW